MITEPKGMLSLLQRQMRYPPGWDDLITGCDFAFLEPEEVRLWALEQGLEGEQGRRLTVLDENDPHTFPALLWSACREATGRIPRPGSLAWAQAQDRWRVALLKDVLAKEPSPEALGDLVEGIYERVGEPEDMLGLWKRADRWSARPAFADAAKVEAFIQKRESPLQATVDAA